MSDIFVSFQIFPCEKPFSVGQCPMSDQAWSLKEPPATGLPCEILPSRTTRSSFLLTNEEIRLRDLYIDLFTLAELYLILVIFWGHLRQNGNWGFLQSGTFSLDKFNIH